MIKTHYFNGIQYSFRTSMPSYRVPEAERCQQCRFSKTGHDGCVSCALYVSGLVIKPRYSFRVFVMVDAFGVCDHFKPRKDMYRLKGIPWLILEGKLEGRIDNDDDVKHIEQGSKQK